MVELLHRLVVSGARFRGTWGIGDPPRPPRHAVDVGDMSGELRLFLTVTNSGSRRD